MEFILEDWLDILVTHLKNAFGSNLVFIGLAGSHARGDASEHSDIDIHIILDSLSMEDLKKYREIVRHMPWREKACGFISSKNDIAVWPAQEIFQFSHGYRTLYGTLDGILPPVNEPDIIAHIKSLASAIYHAASHTFVFGNTDAAEALKGLYKTAFFVLQEEVYIKEHIFVPSMQALPGHLGVEDRKVLGTYMRWDALSDDRELHPEEYYACIIRFARKRLGGVQSQSNC